MSLIAPLWCVLLRFIAFGDIRCCFEKIDFCDFLAGQTPPLVTGWLYCTGGWPDLTCHRCHRCHTFVSHFFVSLSRLRVRGWKCGNNRFSTRWIQFQTFQCLSRRLWDSNGRFLEILTMTAGRPAVTRHPGLHIYGATFGCNNRMTEKEFNHTDERVRHGTRILVPTYTDFHLTKPAAGGGG